MHIIIIIILSMHINSICMYCSGLSTFDFVSLRLPGHAQVCINGCFLANRSFRTDSLAKPYKHFWFRPPTTYSPDANYQVVTLRARQKRTSCNL